MLFGVTGDAVRTEARVGQLDYDANLALVTRESMFITTNPPLAELDTWAMVRRIIGR